ncbi:MAG: tetratricopeptide repeat protein [Myxococcota bacterium]
MTLLVLMSAWLVAGPAHAQEDPNPEVGERDDVEKQALAAYLEGASHYEAGRYPEAIARFREAYDLSPRPQLLYNMANAYERLPDYPQAIQYYREYLASGEAHDVVAVEERLRRLERLEEAREAEASASVPLEVEPIEARPVWPIVTLGATAAVSTVSAATLGILSERAEREALTYCSNTLPGGDVLCDSEAEPFVRRQSRRALAADLSAGVAVVATVSTFVLLARRGSSKKRASVSLVPNVNRSPGLGLIVSVPRRR